MAIIRTQLLGIVYYVQQLACFAMEIATQTARNVRLLTTYTRVPALQTVQVEHLMMPPRELVCVLHAQHHVRLVTKARSNA
jgi:hypothetical protein